MSTMSTMSPTNLHIKSSTTEPCWRSRTIVACTTYSVKNRKRIQIERVEIENIHAGYLAESFFFGCCQQDASQIVLIAAKDAVAVRQNALVVQLLAADQRQHRQNGAENLGEVMKDEQSENDATIKSFTTIHNDNNNNNTPSSSLLCTDCGELEWRYL